MAQASGLGIFLLGTIGIAFFIEHVSEIGLLRMVGWRQAPGFWIFGGLVLVVSHSLWRREKIRTVIIAGGFLGGSLFLDFLYPGLYSLPTWLWLIVGCSMVIIGVTAAWHLCRIMPKLGYMFLGGWIQAAYIYNASPGRFGYFFGGGFIA